MKLKLLITICCLSLALLPMAQARMRQDNASIITLNVKGARERGAVKFDHQAHQGRLNPDATCLTKRARRLRVRAVIIRPTKSACPNSGNAPSAIAPQAEAKANTSINAAARAAIRRAILRIASVTNSISSAPFTTVASVAIALLMSRNKICLRR